MDFQDILKVASKQQGLNTIPKRYSLAVGPPKRDPKVKGVQAAAVQAFLKQKEEELRLKALEEKRKKEELMKKRTELKHNKKARAMAKRTKDNFFGYDGIPLEKKAKKKHGIERPTDQKCSSEDTELEYEEQEAPLKTITKPKAPLRSAPAPMKFTDLLKLAEKNQYEPVEIKVVKKIEERPRTAKELREKEFLERKHKNIDREKEKKMLEREKRLVSPTMSKTVPSSKETISERHRDSGDKHCFSRGSHLPHIDAEKKSRSFAASEKTMRLPSSKSQPGEKTKAGSGDTFQPSPSESHSLFLNGAEKSCSSSHSMGTRISKTVVHETQKSNEHRPSKSPSSHPSHSKSGVVSTPHEKTRNAGAKQPWNSSNSTSGQPGVGTTRPVQSPRKHGGSSNSGPEQQTSGSKRLVGVSGPSGRPVSGSSGRGYPTSNLGSSGQPLSGTGSMGQTVTPVGRPVSGLSGPGRPSSGGTGRPTSGSDGPGQTVSGSSSSVKPRCTVVTETIFSKNIISRPSNGMRPPPPGYKPAVYPQGTQRPPFPPMARKRYLEEDEDEEYDSEMEDFIDDDDDDDDGEPQEEISKHIQEIFGYDRHKYKDESDHALRYMESSWREQQKEEAKSLRLGMQEDLEEMRREKEELKRQKAKKMKLR
ncbi:protein SPT2 homolog [Gracilinanus agilis]|uniref:protein SPT2 homolog n=1 Tax=Gracilinanus agilis TaxID=191870 RepID=UPI001CFDD090|nr:protein SPT2 homolog [Gracilinanus agilis]